MLARNHQGVIIGWARAEEEADPAELPALRALSELLGRAADLAHNLRSKETEAEQCERKLTELQAADEAAPPPAPGAAAAGPSSSPPAREARQARSVGAESSARPATRQRTNT